MMVPTTGWWSTAGHDDGVEWIVGRNRKARKAPTPGLRPIRASWAETFDQSRDGTERRPAEGVTEGIVPVIKELPARVHSLENVRYMAARELRSLARGNAFISYVGIEGWRGARGLPCRPCWEVAKIPADAEVGQRTIGIVR